MSSLDKVTYPSLCHSPVHQTHNLFFKLAATRYENQILIQPILDLMRQVLACGIGTTEGTLESSAL
jgi:hypothetical protein